jgi:AAA domain
VTTASTPTHRRVSHRRDALHNISLTRKEDWAQFVHAKRRTKPDVLSTREINALSDTARVAYNSTRHDWHANLGPFRTPQYQALHEDLWNIVDSNVQDGDRAKGAIAVDAFPGLGKTTAVQQFARQFHLQEIAAHGERTDEGHERWPVCWNSLTGNPTLRELNRSMLGFFAHPGSGRGTANQYVTRALDCMITCEVKILIFDDLHFLRFPSANSVQVSNHFKFIANTFPVTMIFIGVGLTGDGLLYGGAQNRDSALAHAANGFLAEGKSFDDVVLAQTGRRTTPLSMAPFRITSKLGRKRWRELLLTIEHRLALANGGRGMLADELPDYLFERSTGHIGSLMTLINRGCARAIRSGTEALTRELLDHVKLDVAAETARAQVAAALRSGKLSASIRACAADFP